MLVELLDLVPVVKHIFLNGVDQLLIVQILPLLHVVLKLVLLLLDLVNLLFSVLES